MLCPRCQIDFNAGHWGACPHCGEYREGIDGVIKTSTILISHQQGGVFRSLEEVPQPLRQMLVASTTSVNSGTIVIADQGGRERIAAAMRSAPPVLREPELLPLPAGYRGGIIPKFWRVGLLAATFLTGAGLVLYRWLAANRIP